MRLSPSVGGIVRREVLSGSKPKTIQKRPSIRLLKHRRRRFLRLLRRGRRPRKPPAALEPRRERHILHDQRAPSLKQLPGCLCPEQQSTRDPADFCLLHMGKHKARSPVDAHRLRNRWRILCERRPESFGFRVSASGPGTVAESSRYHQCKLEGRLARPISVGI